MLRIDKILVPTDFTVCADCALAHAKRLAERFGAEIHVLHAIVPHKHSAADAGKAFSISASDIAEQLHLSRAAKNSQKKRTNGPGVIQASVHRVSPEHAILEYADQHDIDVIVMGTHGRTGLDRWWSGSVAEHVVRYAPCPVMTIRTCMIQAAPHETARILVPVDFSDHPALTLTYACELAVAYGARLDVLHLVEDESLSLGGVFTGSQASTKSIQRMEEVLEQVFRTTCQDDFRVSTRVRIWLATSGIVESAHKLHSDLLVISTDGRTGVGRLLGGTAAEKIARTAPCPVLTVKSFGKSLLSVPDGEIAVCEAL